MVGSAPANKILTAYGLMEFSDMSKVHDVDPGLISRTQEWLAGQRQADGSWKPDASFINEGAANHYNTDILPSNHEEGKMAARKSASRRRYSKGAGKTVASAMRRRKRGTLRSGKGGKGGRVKSRKQAIGLPEARKKGAKVPRKKS